MRSGKSTLTTSYSWMETPSRLISLTSATSMSRSGRTRRTRFMITPGTGSLPQNHMMAARIRSSILPGRIRGRGSGWISVDYVYGTESGAPYMPERSTRVMPLTRSTILVFTSSRINLPCITGFVLPGRAVLDTSLTNFRLSRTISVGLSGYIKISGSRAWYMSLPRHHI